jgi:hypothetical protein
MSRTLENVNANEASGSYTFTGNNTFSGTNTFGASVTKRTGVAVNSTATLTAAQVATGWISSTSAATVTMTMPTGTLLGTQLGASQGTTFELYIDNSAGANVVTIAPGTNAILSDAGTTTAASFGDVTVGAGVTGVGRFTLMFSSSTAYVYTRTA